MVKPMMHEEPSEPHDENIKMGKLRLPKNLSPQIQRALSLQYIFKTATGILRAGDTDGSRPLRLLTY
jgi:hypothetical protein